MATTKPTTADQAMVDAALDRSQRDREAAAALQAAVEELLRRGTATGRPAEPARYGRRV